MATGTLQINVMNGNIALPIDGADVRVTDGGGLVQTSVTDSGGMAGVFTLEAPEETLSKTPNPASLPFSLYTAQVTKPGYNTMTIENIRIFPGQHAMQNVSLSASVRGEDRAQSIVLPAEKIGDAPDKPFETPLKDVSRVRGGVTIPEYINVHDGAPSNALAANYRVPFKDYIKNVASFEVYPTWSPAALRANILAAISYALNRVYTDWYPARGHDFALASDPGPDPRYVPHGTVYKSISDTADDVFNHYIQKNNHLQPYLAQRGANTTAPGLLSRWGSEDLAQRGYDHMGILRHYYGSDVHLNTAPAVEGLYAYYPGRAMLQGDTSPAVRQLQNYLNVIRGSYPSIPLISRPNGYFEAETLAAVREFQRLAGLSQDGIVGAITWYELARYYAAVAALRNLAGENPGMEDVLGRALPIDPSPESRQKPMLKFGSTGDYVRSLQSRLKELGYYGGEVNGKFGLGTQNAVRALQIANGAAADGIVGPATWTLLENLWAPLMDYTTALPEPVLPIAPPSGTFDYTVSAGDSLYLLSRRFNTTVETIKALNNMTGNIIYIGETLKIPT